MSTGPNGKGGLVTDGGQKKDYPGIHSSGFRCVLVVAVRDHAVNSFFIFLGGLCFFVGHHTLFPIGARALLHGCLCTKSRLLWCSWWMVAAHCNPPVIDVWERLLDCILQ